MPLYAGPHSIAGFRDITDLGQLGLIDEPHRLVLGADMLSPAPAPLFEAETMPVRVSSQHAARMLVPGAQFHAVTGHELGGFGVLQRGGRVLVQDGAQPLHFNERIRPGEMPPHWIRGLLRDDAEIVESDAPVGVVLNGHLVWGHFLLEMLARVHLLAGLRDLGRPMRVAVPTDAPGWVREFLGLYFTSAEMLPYNSETQRVRAPCFVLPGMMMQHYLLHPMMNGVVQALLDRVVGRGPAWPGAPRRLYLSRRRHEGWHAIENEAEVERTMADLGFTVLHPQELPLREQLAVYAGAECIVAQYSSATHNALFAPPGTAVFCFGWMNRCQSGIAALRRQPLGFMTPEGGELINPPANRPPGVFKLRIDCRLLARELPEFLRFALPDASVPMPAAGVAAAPGAITDGLLAGIWQYGRDGDPPSTSLLQFLPGGRIGGYDHPNERRWTLVAGTLAIFSEWDEMTVQFSGMEQAGGRVVLRGAYRPDPSLGIVLRLERDAV